VVRGITAVACALLCGSVSPAAAESIDGEATLTYLTDGGAVPFLWAPLAGTLALDPDLLARWDTTSVIATTAGTGLAAGMFATRDGSAPYHVKGLAESTVSSIALTGAFDALAGKRTSGSSSVFAVGTYGALYLRGHVLRGVRPAWQVAAYSAIGLGAIAISAERARHSGSDWADVAIGGAVGITTSTLFYLYQEGRFSKERLPLKIVPTFSKGVPALSFVGRF
jgi:hypothetical protein